MEAQGASTTLAAGPPNAVVATDTVGWAGGIAPADGARDPAPAISPVCTEELYPLVHCELGKLCVLGVAWPRVVCTGEFAGLTWTSRLQPSCFLARWQGTVNAVGVAWVVVGVS